MTASVVQHFVELHSICNSHSSEALTLATMNGMLQKYKSSPKAAYCKTCIHHDTNRDFDQHVVEFIILFGLSAIPWSNEEFQDFFTLQDIQNGQDKYTYVLRHKCPNIKEDIAFRSIQDMLDHAAHHHDNFFEIWSHFNTEQHRVRPHEGVHRAASSHSASVQKQVHSSQIFMDLMCVSTIQIEHH